MGSESEGGRELRWPQLALLGLGLIGGGHCKSRQCCNIRSRLGSIQLMEIPFDRYGGETDSNGFEPVF